MASDLPDMIREIEQDLSKVPQDAWGELGSYLIQDCLHEAAYAVVPHIVRIAEQLPAAQRCHHLTFAGACVASENNRRAAECPNDLIEGFQNAKSLAVDLTAETLKENHSPKDTIELLAAMAAFKGRIDLASFLFGMDFPMECPRCNGEIEPLYEVLNPRSSSIE